MFVLRKITIHSFAKGPKKNLVLFSSISNLSLKTLELSFQRREFFWPKEILFLFFRFCAKMGENTKCKCNIG